MSDASARWKVLISSSLGSISHMSVVCRLFVLLFGCFEVAKPSDIGELATLTWILSRSLVLFCACTETEGKGAGYVLTLLPRSPWHRGLEKCPTSGGISCIHAPVNSITSTSARTHVCPMYASYSSIHPVLVC